MFNLLQDKPFFYILAPDDKVPRKPPKLLSAVLFNDRISVADPDVYPRSRILIFIHPGSNNSTKRGGGKQFFFSNFFCSHKYQKIVNSVIFQQVKKIFQTLGIIVLFTPKFFITVSYQKYGFGIRHPRSHHPRSQIRIRNTR
jgi:hypothetical protein